VLLVRLPAVSQRPIKDDDSWRYREAGGWAARPRHRCTRRVVRLAPVTAAPQGVRCALVVPSELDAENTSPYFRWRLATYGPFPTDRRELRLERVSCPIGRADRVSTPVPGRGGCVAFICCPGFRSLCPTRNEESATWSLDVSLKPRTGYRRRRGHARAARCIRAKNCPGIP